MNNFLKIIFITAALFSISFATAQTADAFEKIKKSEVPLAAISALEKQLESDKLADEWRYDLSTYEAKIEGKGTQKFYRFNQEGTFLEKRILLDWKKDAPQKLKDAKNKSYFKNSKVIEFYQAKRHDGEVYYVLQLEKESDNSIHTLYFDDVGGLSEKSKSGY